MHRPSPLFRSLVCCLFGLILLLGGCATATLPADSTAAPSPTAATEETSPAESGEETFQNPVFRHDFPDPGILRVDGIYYGYATNASGRNVQLATSPDLVDWDLQRDALPALPSWAQLGGSFVWAPEVIQIGDTFVLYITARDKTADRQCIGVAVSDTPDGRFTPVGDAPLVCQVDEGGSIDASPFRDDDGQLYLYWKNDGNCCAMPTYLYGQPLAEDGLSLTGEPVRLVRNDEPWEGGVVEAPTMWRHDDAYYLFFSANSYAGAEYAVGYATCESPLGPCKDAEENPILSTGFDQNPPVIGPGHQTIVVDESGDTWMVYHAWEVTSAGTKASRRFLWIDRLVWEEGRPVVQGPTTEVQPVP
jgi:beta-xylosidase